MVSERIYIFIKNKIKMGWGVSVYIETKLEMAHTQLYKFTGCTSSDCSCTLGRVCSLVGHLKRRWENMILLFLEK